MRLIASDVPANITELDIALDGQITVIGHAAWWVTGDFYADIPPGN